MSSQTPMEVRNRLASDDFERFSTSLLTTRGSVRSSRNLWPRLRTTWSDAVAAIADFKASRLYLWLIRLASFFDVNGGNAFIPFNVPETQAAVPVTSKCPSIRGTR